MGQGWTGACYYRARYYDPVRSRFVSEDLLGLLNGGPNDFTYALNNPLMFVDPLGLCPPGSHPATLADVAKILSAARNMVNSDLSYKDVKCNQFVSRSVNEALPGAFPRSYTTSEIGRGVGSFEPTNTPEVGNVIYFADPGHVGLVTQLRQGRVSQFVGSQTSTGPAYVNLPDYYWQGKINANGNVQYYGSPQKSVGDSMG